MQTAAGVQRGDAGPFGSIAAAETYVKNNDPTATFMSTQIDYPNGDGDLFETVPDPMIVPAHSERVFAACAIIAAQAS